MPALRERGKKPRYSKRYSVFVFNPFNNTYHSLYTPFKKSIAKTKKKGKMISTSINSIHLKNL